MLRRDLHPALRDALARVEADIDARTIEALVRQGMTRPEAVETLDEWDREAMRAQMRAAAEGFAAAARRIVGFTMCNLVQSVTSATEEMERVLAALEVEP